MIALTQPALLSWSRNPIPIELQSDDYLDDAGSVAIAVINLSTIVNADTFPLVWSGGNVTFIVASSPDNSGRQIPFGDGSAAYVSTVIPWLNKNFLVNRDFFVTQALDIHGALLPQITLTAKLTGVNFTITPVTTGDITVTSTPGANTDIKSNFAQRLEVWQKASPDEQLYSNSLSMDYPETGLTTKSLQQILHPYLDYDIPDLGQVWQPCAASFMEYYLKFAEVYGDTPVVQGLSQTGSSFVYLGGYSNLALNTINNNSSFLQTALLPTPLLFEFQRWFENFPLDNFNIRTNQPQLLYFINNRTVAETLNIRVDITFDTAGPQSIVIAGGLLQPFNKVCINCSYKALGLHNYTTIGTKEVIGYTVILIEATSGNNRSLSKTFTVDRSYQPYVRYILYGDSAGNFKTFQFTGTSQLTSDFTDDTAMAFTDQNTPFLGNIKRYNILATLTDEINTGYIDAVGYDNLNEMLFAKTAFRVFENALVPIVFTPQKFNYSADGNNLNGAKIEYTMAFQEAVYTAGTGALFVPPINQPQTPLNT